MNIFSKRFQVSDWVDIKKFNLFCNIKLDSRILNIQFKY